MGINIFLPKYKLLLTTIKRHRENEEVQVKRAPFRTLHHLDIREWTSQLVFQKRLKRAGYLTPFMPVLVLITPVIHRSPLILQYFFLISFKVRRIICTLLLCNKNFRLPC